MRTALAALFVLAAGSAPASSADLALELAGGYQDLGGARQSAKAVFDGAAGGPAGRLGVRVALGAHALVRASAGYFRRRGERVFVADADSPAFRLGHPLELRLVPAYLDVAWGLRPEARFQPYVGLGLGAVFFDEESTVAGETFTERRTRPSGRALVGALWGHAPLRVGVEASYAHTPDTIGIGGVSEIYDENDVGGASLLVTLTWRP